PFPEPWCTAYKPQESMIRTLAELGVIPRFAPDDDRAAIARDAGAAARAWLADHPPPGPPKTA
ncbi:MAG: hypothetical protein LC685_02420, partial [Actinobacteria bacterium]|nr:hypothetical protein [Actinomycetota bacterium]